MKSRSRLLRLIAAPAAVFALVGAFLVVEPARSLTQITASYAKPVFALPTLALRAEDGVVRLTSDYWEKDTDSSVTFDVNRIEVAWFSCDAEAATAVENGNSAGSPYTGCTLVETDSAGTETKIGTLGYWDYTYDLDTQRYIRAMLSVTGTLPTSTYSVNYWTPTVELAPAQNPNQTPSPDPYQSPPPYDGPVIGFIDYQPPKPEDTDKPYDDKPRPGGELIMEGPGTEDIEEASIDGKPADVRREDEKTIITIPEDIEPGVKDIILEGPFGELTLQDAIEIYPPLEDDEDLPANFTRTKPSECTPRDIEFSAWTQDQLDGTVLFLAKNVVGAGEISFQQNRKDLLTQTAVSEDDPRIRWGNCSPYFLHRFTREEVKNGLEVYQDGVRVWRAAYSGTGIK